MNDREKLLEIIRLYDEAFEHAVAEDGCCKSSDGCVQVSYGTVHDRREGLTPGDVAHVDIYAYTLGPSRWHSFDSLDHALATMRDWHKAEMEHDYSEAL